MAKIIQDELVGGLIKYLLERPAKEVLTAILALQALPNAPVDENKEDKL